MSSNINYNSPLFPVHALGKLGGITIYRITYALYLKTLADPPRYYITEEVGVCKNADSCRTYGNTTMPKDENMWDEDFIGILVSGHGVSVRQSGPNRFHGMYLYVCRKCGGAYSKQEAHEANIFLGYVKGDGMDYLRDFVQQRQAPPVEESAADKLKRLLGM